ncbi:hypothetical protein ACDA63_18710 [Uliginosibacterium sp. sgz301328]|uniref:hypothetical protein n=1 Tax=Uliginosibacterium sp. sgz301328 TaxID=3243764 RepID=UPI00359EE0F1
MSDNGGDDDTGLIIVFALGLVGGIVGAATLVGAHPATKADFVLHSVILAIAGGAGAYFIPNYAISIIASAITLWWFVAWPLLASIAAGGVLPSEVMPYHNRPWWNSVIFRWLVAMALGGTTAWILKSERVQH